ncbi:hypothetical protein GOSPT_152_00320 [Gordonia sputi NBRC 100414]|uniref:Uncharacterized protein n=1 Tax=Gordonia sputi NBRC 100414 TaxID=1089453 RepID=H5U7M5_9ACTN|nr:hypothetical protein GOSPT_152_00320 [Gordonia sputi NBRC 100414]
MHGDLWSSDSTPFAGPGRTAHLAASSIPGGACAATFVGHDGMPVSLCTQFVGIAPLQVAVATVTLFDPTTAAPIARKQLTKGGLLGGVYGYLDDRDRVVVADGSGAILRVAHRHSTQGWQLYIDDRVDLKGHIPAGDAVTALAPDFAGRVWFVTTHGVVGTVDAARRVRSTHLPAGEDLGNGLSVRASGVSVISTHALYEMRAGVDGTPEVVWRRAYDRGAARRPGQLTWGSGTTPTYFGPGGDGWVAIVDNASRPQLIVYDSNTGSTVCRMPAFGSSGQGTENSPMAWGNSLIIPSTYGYQYPPMAVSGPSVPANAPFVGGSTRIDVSSGECHRVWENGDRLASLPRLSRGRRTHPRTRVRALSTGIDPAGRADRLHRHRFRDGRPSAHAACRRRTRRRATRTDRHHRARRLALAGDGESDAQDREALRTRRPVVASRMLEIARR